MHRFYSVEPVSGDRISISDPQQVHQIRDVLRMKEDERLVVFDGTGKEYIAEIDFIGRERVEARVVATRAVEPAKGKLAIACALPKMGRMDEIVDSLTQIGVDVIMPMVTERTVVKPDQVGKRTRLTRWRKIAVSAARQSQRSSVPDIPEVMTFDEVLKQSSQYPLRLIAALCEGTRPIHDVANMAVKNYSLVLIGPEGDFTPQEVEAATQSGFTPVSLGKNVLRVATAAIVVAAYIKLSAPPAE
jgi:16S rRNA (uracil1498-N3)-methyltransferase